MPTQGEEKNTRTEIVKPKILILSSNTLSRYQTNMLLHRSNIQFKPTPKRDNIELKPNTQNYTRSCDLLSFLKTKKHKTLRTTFFKNNLFLPHLETGIEIDIIILMF